MKTTQRIEYIDAMRGCTMILVVYSHVCGFCFGSPAMGGNDVLFLFRLPCFFFISGWLFEKVGRQWSGVETWAVIRRKFRVQVVPTFVFLLLLAPPPLFFSRLGATKGGYWFTFVLFEFFLLCIFSERFLKRFALVFALLVSVAAFCYDVYFSRLQTVLWEAPRALSCVQYLRYALGFLSFMTWRYYLFFFLGTWAKRHADLFLQLTSRPLVVLLVGLAFVSVAALPRTESAAAAFLAFAVGGVSGLTLVFTLFRHCWHRCSGLALCRPLPFIGRRTLDIYLLHYFFLPRFLVAYSPQLLAYDSHLVEALAALGVALPVVALSLLASRVIRYSPFLARWLFGSD